jgi:hypothetical protein
MMMGIDGMAIKSGHPEKFGAKIANAKRFRLGLGELP